MVVSIINVNGKRPNALLITNTNVTQAMYIGTTPVETRKTRKSTERMGAKQENALK